LLQRSLLPVRHQFCHGCGKTVNEMHQLGRSVNRLLQLNDFDTVCGGTLVHLSAFQTRVHERAQADFDDQGRAGAPRFRATTGKSRLAGSCTPGSPHRGSSWPLRVPRRYAGQSNASPGRDARSAASPASSNRRFRSHARP